MGKRAKGGQTAHEPRRRRRGTWGNAPKWTNKWIWIILAVIVMVVLVACWLIDQAGPPPIQEKQPNEKMNFFERQHLRVYGPLGERRVDSVPFIHSQGCETYLDVDKFVLWCPEGVILRWKETKGFPGSFFEYWAGDFPLTIVTP